MSGAADGEPGRLTGAGGLELFWQRWLPAADPAAVVVIAHAVAEPAAAIDRFPAALGAITIPTLIMYGTAGGLCPPAGSVMLSERIGADDLTAIPYDGLFHEFLNESEQDRVLDDICSWLRAHVAAVAE